MRHRKTSWIEKTSRSYPKRPDSMPVRPADRFKHNDARGTKYTIGSGGCPPRAASLYVYILVGKIPLTSSRWITMICQSNAAWGREGVQGNLFAGEGGGIWGVAPKTSRALSIWPLMLWWALSVRGFTKEGTGSPTLGLGVFESGPAKWVGPTYAYYYSSTRFERSPWNIT